MTSKKKLESDTYKSTALESFKQANLSVERLVYLSDGEKGTNIENWTEKELPSLEKAPKDYGIRTGNGLVVLDIDNEEETPERILQFIKNNPTYGVDSAHAEGIEGHWYYAVDGQVKTIKRIDGIDILGEGSLVVGPGSELTDCKHEDCCSPSSPGKYKPKNDSPICKIPKERLEAVLGKSLEKTENSSAESIDLDSLPQLSREKVQLAQSVLRDLQSENTPFFKCLLDRLNGGRGNLGDSLNKDGGKINRSRQDFITLKDLYGVFQYYDYSQKEAEELAVTTYSSYCRESPYTKDGQAREWVSSDNQYRKKITHYATDSFSPVKFRNYFKSLNSTHSIARRENNLQSETTENYCLFACELLTGEYEDDPLETIHEFAQMHGLHFEERVLRKTRTIYLDNGDPPSSPHSYSENYPTASDIYELAKRLNPNPRSEKSHKNALVDLVGSGTLKLAFCPYRENGRRYVYYPVHFENPTDARWVKCDGRICLDCGGSMLHDQAQDTHYCPICENQSKGESALV